jgi:predicted branched-subunit amino acid permease
MKPAKHSHAEALRRVAPAVLAIIPVGMLFGVLASRSDWSLLDVALIGLLGFSGSGQFALLPLADSGAGFFTMLLLTASINSRYLPIAYVSAQRLPRQKARRALLAHLLGDEAYATERDEDRTVALLLIRGSIFVAWVLAGLVGAAIERLIPSPWLDTELNVGYPASVVLMYLAISQLRARLPMLGARFAPLMLAVILCATTALLLIVLLGPLYFWIPSVVAATLVLTRIAP